MEVFRELNLDGRREDIESAFDAVDRELRGGWTRSRESEAEMQSVSELRWRVYDAPATDEHPAARLFFCFDDGRVGARASNIVPHEIGSLSMHQYNAILLAFTEKYLRPACPAAVKVRLTLDSAAGKDLIGVESYELLRKFSALANRSTGSSHPLDQARWFDFIYAAYRGSPPDAGKLARVLTEEFRWSDESVAALVGEYEFALALLRHGSSGR